MADKIVIASLDIDVNALIKSTSEVKQVIDQVKKAQAELVKQGDTSSAQYVQNSADLKTLNQAYNANLKAISESTNAKAEEANRTQLLNIALQAEATSIKEARDQNALLNKLRNETNVTTEEGAKELALLNSKLDENNDFIKENADAYLQQKINIGNYSDSIKDALSNLNPLNGGLSGFIERSQQAGGVGALFTTSLKAVAQGIIGVTRASLAFLATPIGAVIGAIGLAIGALVTYLKQSQSGIDAVTSVTRPLQAVFSALLGVVGKIGKAIFEAFSNPKKTLMELADFVKQNLINRFTAFGEILEGIITLDFKKLSNGVLQAGTGVENLTDKIQNGAKETANFLDDAIKKGQEIDQLTKQIERDQLAFNKAQIQTNDLIDEQLLISKDTSRSFAEREKASLEIIRLTGEQGAKEEEIIKKKIRILQLEQSLKDAKEITIEEQQKLIDLEVALDEAQDRALNARLEQQRVISGARKEAQQQAEEAEKRAQDLRQKLLDDLLKKSQAELALFLSSQGVRAKSFEEELKLAEQTYQKEIEIAQLAFNATKKTEIDKLNFLTAQNEAKNKLADSQLNLVIANAELELQKFVEFNNSKLDAEKFLTTELVNEEKARLDLIAKERADFEKVRLEQGVINEQQYNDAINGINADNALKLKEIDDKKKQADAEKAIIDLENQRALEDLIFQDNLAIEQQRLEQQRQVELTNAEKTGADVTKINAKYDQLQRNLDKQNQLAKLDAFQNTIGQIGGLLNAFGVKNKNLSIALATADAFLSATKAYASQLIVGDPSSFGRAVVAGGLALGSGLANVAQIAKTDTKFEKGGIQMVGGKSHSLGGTKFFGTDGTRFEAQSDELIGVLNRNASRNFMSFNDAFGSKGSVNTSFAQNGGLIARGMNSKTNDIEQLATITSDVIANMPNPVVTVEEINSVANRVNVIESGASFG